MTREEKEQTGKYVLQMARLLEEGCYQQEMLLKAVHIIDEVLDQETTTKNLAVDAVSRQEINVYIDYILSHGMGKKKSFDFIKKFVANLPPVTPQETRWIPVSERLPKIADVYRVTRRYKNNVMNPEYLVDACFFDGSDTWYNDNRINHERGYVSNIIAWQENPEPYKVKSHESEGNE